MEDTLDMSTNIMDYSPCPTDFTLGQAERMHFTLDQSYPSLASLGAEGPLCQSPCDADVLASFDIGNEYPIPGESVTFESEVISADSVLDYRWYVQSAAELWTEADTTSQVGTSEDLSFAFSAEGVYRVTLHVRRAADPGCFASFAANVIVTCGVDARFYPDKRIIASKQPHALMTDSVTFTNRSHGGTSWEWTVQHRNFDDANPSLPDTISSDRDLTFYFREPGEYSVRLVATEGACVDASNTFTFDVLDPTIDGAPAISDLACTGNELAVTYSIFNFGYDTINAGTPVAFYDADPTQNANAQLLRATVLPRLVYGFEREEFVTRLPNNVVTLPELFIVFNDTGTVELPLSFPPGDQDRLSTQTVFPPSGYSELTYGNNVASYAIDVSLEAEVVACEGDILELDSRELFDPLWCWDSISWVSENQGSLGSTDAVAYTAREDDLIEVTFRHDSGVVSTGRLTVLINDPADAVSVPDTVYRIPKGGSTRINVSTEAGYSYEWSPDEGLDDPFAASPIAEPEENTRYTVLITDPEGCTATFGIQVWVETTAYLPNLFTPNQDGANDRLLAYDLQGVRELFFRIFNRNGAEVFSSDNASSLSSSGWDGSSGGAPQPSGTYFWELQGSYEDGRPLRFNGNSSGVVHLVR
ncbi:MAG: gliding motility-associated C-terminal domain-containing protein, partial [Bacteroidota bacterium]